MVEDDFSEIPGVLVVSSKSATLPVDLSALVEGWQLTQLEPRIQVDDVRKLLQWRRRGAEEFTTVVIIEFAPAALDTTPLRAALAKRAEIDWAAPDVGFLGDPRELVPNDPQYAAQYHHPLMQNDDAWNITLGSSSVILGITDDGTDIDHADLVQNIWVNTGEIPGDGLDNDGNGYIDDVNGYDFVLNNNDPNPNVTSNDHGTHVAGIAAARTNNAIGVAGTAGGSTIMPLQFYASNATWTASDIAESFAYGVDNGARILSTSYNIDGWVGNPIVTAAFDYIYDQGALHFNSAGNGNQLNPARQSFHQSLLVANTNASDQRSSSSNYGDGVDLAAPGSSILSTILNDQYGLKSGTSMAAPNAAGVAALVWSAFPTWTRDQVAAQVYGSADNIDAQNPAFVGLLGGGRVNSFRAVTATLTPPRLTLVEGLPAEGATLVSGSFGWSLRFDRILDPVAANDPSAFRIEFAGPDGVFGTADDVSVAVDHAEYLIGANELTFSLLAPLANVGLHRFLIDAQVLADPFGTAFDGNGDGVAGDSWMRTFSVCGESLLFVDNVESGTGWSVVNQNVTGGAWDTSPQVPNGGGVRNDPVTDFDGSGRCFLTQNGPGNTDVDGGPTRLISRAFDLSGVADPFLSFALWISATGSEDIVEVHISGDDGATWTLVDTYNSFGGWNTIQLRVADFVAPSATTRLRWSAQDVGTGTILEAAVDAIRAFEPVCGGPASVGASFCSAPANSTGGSAAIRGEGSDVVAANDLMLIAEGLPFGQFGLFFSGPNDGGTPLGNGQLCIAGPLTRYAPLVVASAAGEARLALDLLSLPASLSAIPGATVRYQYWFRDPAAGGSQSNLSDGLRITWQ